jgi:sec-independent protein translocase protein TatB
VFDVGLGEMIVLVVLALVIFGDRLPTVAGQAGRTLRQLRMMANNAKRDLQDGLGPEFKDFDIADLNPKTFVRKHLLEDADEDNGTAFPKGDFQQTYPEDDPLHYGERPPYDVEAT